MKPNFERNSRAHQTWLAAVFILVLAQTWPLRAQTPPAPEPVMLQAKRALRMTFTSRTGEKYQVWQSQDLKTWEKYGHVIDGTGAEIVLVHVTDDPRQLSFRAESLRGQIVEVAKELIDFKTYPSWRLVRTLLGPDPALGDAHGGGQFFRSIYVSPSNAKLVDGQFSAGTIVVKELRTNHNGKPGPITEALTIMVKRGAAFDAAGNNWEYFMANPELTQTMLRGSSSSMCFGCHSGVKNLDFVFSTPAITEPPAEVVKELADFKNYASWKHVRTLLGPDPFLGDAHGGGQFFRSIYLSPSDAKLVNGQLPVGTVIVKELRTNDNGKPGPITEALTVMVKRGGNFDPAGNNWEYFMANPELTQSMLRGGSSTMCFGCHGAVKNLDYVFSVPALTP